MFIRTSDKDAIQPFLKKLYTPPARSHKGQNGKVLVIGGSSLFHSASIWAAEIASHFVDIVFYSSIPANNEIVQESKRKFQNGIVVPRRDLADYIEEADSVLIGPGMVRGKLQNFQFSIFNFQNILKIEDEASQTFYLTKYLLEKYPHKQFVIDAGALQMMDKEWLKSLKKPPILTPHRGEFARLFGKVDIDQMAREYKSITLHKEVKDTISDGKTTVVVEGGNPGLAKGGSGDVLAGLALAFVAKGDPFAAAVVASYTVKRSADELFQSRKYWYNISKLIDQIPVTFASLI